MKKLFISIIVFIISIYTGFSQDNVFLNRGYWKANPSIEKIEIDIAAGNDPTAMTNALFDGVCYALLEKTDNKIIKQLLTKKGNEVHKLTHDGRTYLMWAVYANNIEMVKYLVEKGAKATVKGSHGYNTINFAARGGVTNTKLYDFLIANGADINDKNNSGANPILLIASATAGYKTKNSSKNISNTIEYFVDKGLNINDTDNTGNGLFNYAARGGEVELLKKLHQKGLAYNIINKNGENAISMASLGINNPKNGLKTIQYLESLGLQLNITDTNGRTPLHNIAHRSENLDIFKYLVDKGAKVNQQDTDGNSPFMNAANSNSLAVVEYLFLSITDINLKNKKGLSALTMAVNKNSVDVLEFLIQNGANTNIKDSKNNSLAYYLLNTYSIKKPGIFETKLKWLQEKKVSMTESQNNQNTLLHLAVKENNFALLKRLKDFKIDINQRNKEGNTALHLAAMSSKNEAILKYLIANGADKSLKTEFEETAFDLANENELLTNLDYLK